MIREVSNDEVMKAEVSKCGPRTDKTRAAQTAVEEFLSSGVDAAEVDWESIDPDWTAAKRAVAYRINYSKNTKLDGAEDLGMRSDRDEGKLYLVHLDKLGE